jgi:DMSO/TMAO reductase YedYZ molybdopterin-dependent catalytic subunit
VNGVRVDGLVARPGLFDFQALSRLPEQVPDVRLLVPERRGGAVPLRAVLAAAGVDPAAQSIELAAADASFRQTAPLASLGAAVLVYRLADAPLPADDGGPIRFLVPAAPGLAGVDRCTNVKGLGSITVRKEPA